jgi:hypothetical protein
MMIRIALFGFLVLVLFSVGLANAEIYKYRDAQGVIRYTYDLGEVPEDQRPGIKSYEEEVAPTVESTPSERVENASIEQADNESSEEAPLIVDDQKIEELNQKKKKLDQEFADLMEEKYKLIKEKERLETLAGRDANAVAAYEGKVKELNRKIADYQKRQEGFQKEVDEVKEAAEASDNPQQ